MLATNLKSFSQSVSNLSANPQDQGLRESVNLESIVLCFLIGMAAKFHKGLLEHYAARIKGAFEQAISLLCCQSDHCLKFVKERWDEIRPVVEASIATH